MINTNIAWYLAQNKRKSLFKKENANFDKKDFKKLIKMKRCAILERDIALYSSGRLGDATLAEDIIPCCAGYGTIDKTADSSAHEEIVILNPLGLRSPENISEPPLLEADLDGLIYKDTPPHQGLLSQQVYASDLELLRLKSDSLIEQALLLEPLATALYAIKECRLQNGQTILILNNNKIVGELLSLILPGSSFLPLFTPKKTAPLGYQATNLQSILFVG